MATNAVNKESNAVVHSPRPVVLLELNVRMVSVFKLFHTEFIAIGHARLCCIGSQEHRRTYVIFDCCTA